MNSFFSFVPQEVITSLGWTFLHSLWQGAVIAVLLYILLFLLRNKSSNLRNAVSAGALGLFVLTAVVTCINVHSPENSRAEGITLNSPEGSFISHLEEGSAAAKSAAERGIYSLYADAKKFINNNIEIVFALWIAGLFCFALRFAGGAIYMARVRRFAVTIEDEYWNNIINKLSSRINLNKRVRLAETVHLKVPVAMGYIKPVVLFPIGVLSGLPQEQIEAIIAHEIAHIKRYDLYVNLFQSAAEIVFFFNPFVWWISGRIRLEREFCCDDIAIKQCGDELIYAKALANLDSLIDSNMPLFAVPLFKNHHQLLRRINRMLQQDQNRNNFKEKFTAALFFIGLLVTAAVFSNANAQTVSSKSVKHAPVVKHTEAVNHSVVDSVRSAAGSGQFIFDYKENGTTKRFNAKLKKGKIESLYINDEKIAEKDFPKYEKTVMTKVKEHEEQMAKHNIQMKQHEADMQKHEQDMKKHEFDMQKKEEAMKKHEQDLKKHDQDLKKHEQDMVKFEQEMKRHESDLQNNKIDKKKYEEEMKAFERKLKAEKVKQEKEMQKHEIEMQKHEQQMKVHEKEMQAHQEQMKKHEAEMKIQEAFHKDLEKLLTEEKLLSNNSSYIAISSGGSNISVDGKQVPETVAVKVRKLYKEHYGREMGENTSVQINMK